MATASIAAVKPVKGLCVVFGLLRSPLAAPGFAAVFVASLCLVAGPAAARTHRPAHRHHAARTQEEEKEPAYFLQNGRASWYGAYHNGKMTASGENFDPTAFTAAHPWLPFGTIVRVTNLSNHRMVKVRVTDRGPHAKSRVIDVSAAAAHVLHMEDRGVVRVKVRAYHSDQGLKLDPLPADSPPADLSAN